MNDETKARGWGQIILILVVVAVAAGLLLGLLNMLFPVPQMLWKGGIGAVVGIAAAILIAQRRAAKK